MAGGIKKVDAGNVCLIFMIPEGICHVLQLIQVLSIILTV